MKTNEDATHLPAGYLMRPPTLDDVPACLALIARCAEALGAPERYEPDELIAEWETPEATLDRNFRIIEDRCGKVVAYGETWDIRTPPVSIWTWSRVDPAHEGQGLGTILMRWAEMLARGAVDRCPADAKVVIRAAAINDHVPTHELFLERGMKPIRQFYAMKIRFRGQPPQTPAWPDGLTLRAYRHPEDLEAVIAADYEAFRDHWGFIERPLEEEIAHWRHFTATDPFFDPRYWFMVVDGEEVAGVVICSPVSPEGKEYAHVRVLSVRRPWRRRGVATALLLHAFGLAYGDGKAGVTLGVDAENLSGAMRLYTRAGMTPSKVNHVYEAVIRDGVSLSNEG